MSDEILQNAWRLHQDGRLDEAARLYQQVAAAQPQRADVLQMLAFLYFQSGQFENAHTMMERATALEPMSPDAWYNRGRALLALERHRDAVPCFSKALSLKPDFTAALVNRGNAVSGYRDFEQALLDYDAALKISPADTDALNNRGNALLEMKRPADALASYDRAVASDPNHPLAWSNRGNALLEMRRYADAVASYDRAVAIAPDYADAWSNRGNALLGLKRSADAITSFDRALALFPQHTDALANRANALSAAGRYDAAIRDYAALLEADPAYPFALGNLVHCKYRICDWRDLNGLQDAVASDLRHGKPVLTPMQNLAVSASAADQLQCAQVWVHHDAPPSPLPLWNGEAYGHERLRVAYVSADYREHAVASLIVGVLEEHDRKRFEVIGASLADGDGSALRQRIEKACERFVDVSGKSDGEAAALLRQMEVDIAVDLTGFTGNGRAAIFAQRFAPVQINFLGFSGTMGAPYMDYIVGDRIVIPETDQAYYSEAVIRLPDTYMPSDGKRKIGRIPSRVEAGLPETGFVFCSFNNAYKFNPPIFDIWMRLLKEIVGSVLWLPQANDAATRNLKNEAKNRGVDPGRLIFAPFARNAEDHLARLSLADLFLDTLPYNAHSTANDALWAGVPVLTCTGSTFAGRVAASLLTAIGLAELITRTLADYESLALNLARDPAKLAGLKAKLAANRLAFPLFDTSRFTKNIEDAYIRIAKHTGRS